MICLKNRYDAINIGNFSLMAYPEVCNFKIPTSDEQVNNDSWLEYYIKKPQN
jgi:hypothetical protein